LEARRVAPRLGERVAVSRGLKREFVETFSYVKHYRTSLRKFRCLFCCWPRDLRIVNQLNSSMPPLNLWSAF